MGMDIFIIALLIFIGLVMVILEVFFLPGITIAGISAVLFFVGAVMHSCNWANLPVILRLLFRLS